MGVCQPVLLYSGPVAELAVDDAGIYFAPTTGQVLTCPLTGCVLTPTVAATAGAPFYLAGGDLAYIGSYYGGGPYYSDLTLCPATGCTAANEFQVASSSPASGFTGPIDSPGYFFYTTENPTGNYIDSCKPMIDGGCDLGSWQVPGSNGLPQLVTASNSFVYFTAALTDAGTTDLYACPGRLTGCVPTRMNAGYYSEIYAFGSDLYVLPYAGGPITNYLIKCPSTGCGATNVIPMTSGTPFAVDDSGIYWTSGSDIEMCPFSGCGVAPTVVAKDQGSPAWLGFSPGFV